MICIIDKVSTPSVRLADALAYRNMRPIDLSNKTQISKTSISKYMAGEYEPKQEAVFQMASALEVSPIWLAGYNAPMFDASIALTPFEEMIFERCHKNKSFRELIYKISNLKPEQLEIISKLLDVFN